MVKQTNDFQTYDNDQTEFDITLATLYRIHYERGEAYKHICSGRFEVAYNMLYSLSIEAMGIVGETSDNGKQFKKDIDTYKQLCNRMIRNSTKEAIYVLDAKMREWYSLITLKLYEKNVFVRKKNINTVGL